MFSPAISVYNSENADSVVQRKTGGNNLVSRKPFLDISVNSKTPDTNKLIKQKNIIKPLLTKSTVKSKMMGEDLNAEEYMFSFKDVEDCYNDIWSESHLNTEDVITILHNYCGEQDTPPPSPEPKQIQLEKVSFDLPVFETNMSLTNSNLLDVEDVEMPSFDFDDLDMSC